MSPPAATTDPASRYRVEAGVTCIDLHMKSLHQLFDNRDPAPFIERDIDDDAADYLIAALEELPVKAPIKLVLWPAEWMHSLEEGQVAEAVHRHFTHARAQVTRRLRRQRSDARRMLLIGLVALAVLQFVAELTSGLRDTPPGHVVPDMFLILSWVVMWRPLEMLLYDWWPLVRERRVLARLSTAPVEIRRPPAP